jgi:hypothetical protein
MASGITLPYQLFLSFALGNAAGPAIEPYARTLSNEAWSTHAVLPPDAIYLAQGVAQGQVATADAYRWAKQQGFDTAQMDAMVDIANVGPPLGLAYEAWRRGQLSDAEFRTALKRTGLEDQWVSALEALKGDRLGLGAIATAVHRGIMDDAGLLVQRVPSGSGNIERIPVSPLSTLAEFAAQGIDPERARVLVADTGLPLALGEMLTLYNRNKVTATDVKVSIAESNVRNEYMDVALDLARRLLTPHEYEEAALRGVISQAEADDGAALSGLTQADSRILFDLLGRPLSVHQMTTGLARGGQFGGTYGDIPEPFRDAVRRSNIRPEYARLAYANRYSYPSAFVLRSLAQAGEVGDAAAVQNLLEEIGWPPGLATKVAAAWTATSGGATADPHVTKAQSQLWTATHSSYVKDRTDDATARTKLAALGVAAGAIPAVLALWQEERELVRAGLTAAQIKKAYSEGTFTQPEAVARLVELGWSAADAGVYLGE